MALSARQVEQYQDDGFVCPVPVMSPQEAAGLRRQLGHLRRSLHVRVLDARVPAHWGSPNGKS